MRPNLDDWFPQVDHPANIHLLKAWLLSTLSHFLCHYSCRLMLSTDNFRNGQSISGFSSLTRKRQTLCTQRTFSAISFWSSLRYHGQHSDIITGFYFLEKVANRWHPRWEAKSCKVHLDFLWNLSRSCVKACSVTCTGEISAYLTLNCHLPWRSLSLRRWSTAAN